jgi:AcrR family transcriptional regulator
MRHIKSKSNHAVRIVGKAMTTDNPVTEGDRQDMPECLRRGRPPAGQDPAKRKQIIDGARRVFIEMGFDAASMNDITRAAGVSKGTIYVYFASKEELFEALIEDERRAIFNNLYEALERGDDLRETLIRYGIGLAVKITSDTVVHAQRTVIGICERIPELGARFYERGPKMGHGKLAEFLKRAMARGELEIADVELAAYQFTDLCLSGYYRQRLFGYRTDAPPLDEIRATVLSGVDVFLKAYGTRKLAAAEPRQAETA